MEEPKIVIAKDFSEKLGGRWESLGPFSGERFYNEHLEKKFLEARKQDSKLHIYLDGTKGYGSSFLDQSFGELARKYGKDIVSKIIVFHTEFFNWNVEYLKEKIWEINS